MLFQPSLKAVLRLGCSKAKIKLAQDRRGICFEFCYFAVRFDLCLYCLAAVWPSVLDLNNLKLYRP